MLHVYGHRKTVSDAFFPITVKRMENSVVSMGLGIINGMKKKTKQIIIPSSQLDEQTELLECSLNSSITHQKPNREREEKKKNVVSRMWWSQMQKPANYAMSLMRWKKVADTTFWLDNSVCLCSGLQVRNKGTCINAQWLIEHEKKIRLTQSWRISAQMTK